MPLGRRGRGIGPVLLALASLVHAAPAAAEPTKQQCVDVNEQAQGLRQRGSLRTARLMLALCVDPACPGPVRQDCADRMAELDRAMPTVAFEIAARDGYDVSHVSLRVDGELESSHLDGAAVAIDPGEHTLQFVAVEGPEHEETIVAREGEKDRRVRVLLESTRVPQPQRVIGEGLVGVGIGGLILGTVLGIVAKVTYDAALSSQCHGNAGTCSPGGVSQASTAHAEALGSTFAFVAGPALIVGGGVLWLTARRSIRVTPTGQGATLSLGGTF
jgi:hypothetical protein